MNLFSHSQNVPSHFLEFSFLLLKLCSTTQWMQMKLWTTIELLFCKTSNSIDCFPCLFAKENFFPHYLHCADQFVLDVLYKFLSMILNFFIFLGWKRLWRQSWSSGTARSTNKRWQGEGQNIFLIIFIVSYIYSKLKDELFAKLHNSCVNLRNLCESWNLRN